jgi:predicted nucleotidyltransferase
LQDRLTELFQRQVDLHTPQSLSRHMRARVLDTAKVIYERERQDALARHVG